MRETYRNELDNVISQLVTMTNSVRIAVQDATKSLVEADLTIAERVIKDDSIIDQMNRDIEEKCFLLLARQAPVAGELRTVVSTIKMIAGLGRMGDLAAHVAKIARMRYPERAIPAELEDSFLTMGAIADDMIRSASRTLRDRDVDAATKLAAQDEKMDLLRKNQFEQLLSDNWPGTVEQAVDVALLGRYYERIADHAVSMASRIIYLVTGETPEGKDWPVT